MVGSAVGVDHHFADGVIEDRLTWRLSAETANRFTVDSGAILAPSDASPRHGSDAFFTGGVAKAINGAAPAEASGWAVARTFREGDFSYRIPAAPGRYTVTLTFVEPIFDKGQRTFDVLANDKVVLGDFDIASQAVGEHARVVRSFPVEIGSAGIDLVFKSKTGKALVSAIDIAPRP